LLLALTVAAMDARFRGLFLTSVGFLFASIGFTLVSADGFVNFWSLTLKEERFIDTPSFDFAFPFYSRRGCHLYSSSAYDT
jgi:hypothetical protein